MTGIIRSPYLDSGIHLLSPISMYDDMIWGGAIPYGNLWNGVDSGFLGWDPLPVFLHNSIYDHGFRDAYFALGISSVDQTNALDLEVPGHKPKNYRYHSAVDHRRYGSLIGNFAILGANPGEARKRFKRDHELEHYNIKGSANASLDAEDSLWYEFPYLHWGWILPGVAGTASGPAGTQIPLYTRVGCSGSVLNPLTTYSNNVIVHGARSITQRVLETLGDEFELIGDGSGGRLGLRRRCHSIRVDEQPTQLHISYVYEVEEVAAVNLQGIATYDVRLVFELMTADPIQSIGAFSGFKWLTPRAPESPSPRSGNYYTKASYVVHRRHHHFINGDGVSEFVGGTPHTASKLFNVWSKGTASYPASVDVMSVSSDLVSAEKRFGKYIEREFNHIRPSSFYSTAEAMESHLLSLENNYLESLTELGELVRLAPDFPLLIRALVLWRKDPGAAATAFGDFVSGFVLKYNFAWKPNASVVAELDKVGPTLGTALDRFSESRTITVSGEFHYTFPRHPYWGSDIRLKVRSTARIEYADSEFAQIILKLDSLGLLPDLHRVWETLPYSFAVDWMTSVGRRLHDIDSQVKLFSLMQLHWVEHTYSFTVPVPSHISLDGVDISSGDLRLAYFKRELSRRIPPLRDSKYDFREPAGITNVGVLASLLWNRS